MMDEYDRQGSMRLRSAPYHPGEQCPCGTEGCTGSKLTSKTGHVVGCICKPCQSRSNQRSGARHQSRILKAAAAAEGTRMDTAPTHEEAAKLLVHYEVKSGEQVLKASAKTLLDWEKQARLHAERQTPRKKWAVVSVFPDGKERITMDFHDFLLLVSELQELP